MKFWVNSEANQQPEGLELPYRGYRVFNVGTNEIKEWDGDKWVHMRYLKVGDQVCILDTNIFLTLASETVI